MDVDPVLLGALAAGLIVVGGVVALVVWAMRRHRTPGAAFTPPPQVWSGIGQPVGSPVGSPFRPAAYPRLGPAESWQAAGPSLQAMGMKMLDAECYTLDLGRFGETLFVKLHLRDGGLRAWVERPCPGGVLELYVGAEADLKPGDAGRSDLARFAAGAVREVLGVLPKQARLNVKAPEIPGDSYKSDLTTPFHSPDQASIAARVLLALDEAARRPAPAGVQAPLPPAVMCWQAAVPMLQALGMTMLDAECFTLDLGRFGETLFVKLHVRDATLRGWVERPCPGGVLEQYIGASAELQPGEPGRSDLARFAAGAVREVLGALPRQARLSVKAPEIPGDSYKSDLTTPFSTPDQASIVARVLLTLDEAARRPAAPGFQAQLPPVVMGWQAAGPSLEAMGMKMLDAECYTLDLGRFGEAVFVKLQVRDASLRGWVERPCPGGVLERFLGTQVELRPGDPGRSELGAYLAGAVREGLGALPPQARLSVKAPDIPGDSYKSDLTTPFTSSDQPSTVARVLVMLDRATRGPAG